MGTDGGREAEVVSFVRSVFCPWDDILLALSFVRGMTWGCIAALLSIDPRWRQQGRKGCQVRAVCPR